MTGDDQIDETGDGHVDEIPKPVPRPGPPRPVPRPRPPVKPLPAQSDPRNVDVHTNSGSTLSIASNRISYLFDLKGPSVSVDTACSSALVAINLAC